MRPANVFLVPTLFLLAAASSASAQGPCSWSSLGSGVSAGGSASGVTAMTVLDDGTGPALYAGGWFTMVGGVPANHVARWDGASWSSLGGGVSGVVAALTVFDDGTGPALYAAGQFTMAGGVPANGIAKWDGGSWSSLGSGVSFPATTPVVSDLTVFDDGTGPALYAGGSFTMAGGVTVNHIAKWDGSSWSPLGSGVSGGWNLVFALTVFDDGTGPALYAGGLFTMAGGVSANNTARWDGTSWSSVGGGVSGTSLAQIRALTAFDDGTGPALYAGGFFPMAGGVTVNHIARWDGVSWSFLGSGVNSTVFALTVFDDGTGPALYAGGFFTTAGGVAVNRIARWYGASWSPLGGGMNEPVFALTVFDDGTGPALYAGGDLTTAGGVTANHIAKWSCGTSISLSATQILSGTPVNVNNANLTPGNEYYNLFSFDLCPGGPGTGSGTLFGGCVFTPGNLTFVTNQLLTPVGTAPFHVVAPSSYVNWGPFSVPPVTVDAICIDVTGGVIGSVSPVVRITVQ